eukprot:6213108-Pleurochrysis_carterae.AAC.1
MMYKWGHPVATLPSDEWDYTSLSQKDVNSANHRSVEDRLPGGEGVRGLWDMPKRGVHESSAVDSGSPCPYDEQGLNSRGVKSAGFTPLVSVAGGFRAPWRRSHSVHSTRT